MIGKLTLLMTLLSAVAVTKSQAFTFDVDRRELLTKIEKSMASDLVVGDSAYFSLFWDICTDGNGVFIPGETIVKDKDAFQTIKVTRVPNNSFRGEIVYGEDPSRSDFFGSIEGLVNLQRCDALMNLYGFSSLLSIETVNGKSSISELASSLLERE